MSGTTPTPRTTRRLIACLMAALALAPNGIIAAQPAASAPKSPPTSLGGAEARELQSFMSSLLKFGDEVDAAGKAAKGQRPLAPLQQRANELKLGLPSAQRNLSTLISRLKESGNWTQDFDRFVEERMKQTGTDPIVVSYYRNHGGARNVFTEATRMLAQLSGELDSDVRGLSAANDPAGVLQVLLPRVYAISHAVKCGALFFVTGVCIGLGLAPCALGTGASALVCAAS
jgi:hypothetical protein